MDNTADPSRTAFPQRLLSLEVEILRNAENVGIAAALNQGLARAIELGYKWAMTFDQDSWARPNLVATLIEIVEQQPHPELVGIVGCNFEHESIELSSVTPKRTATSFSEVQTVITSGSLLSEAVFYAAGPFRSDFFIDFVDHEYCLRLRKLGYKVLTANAPLMVHALGDPTTFTFDKNGTFSLILTNRSPLRRYYMARNGLAVARTYFRVAPLWALRTVASVLAFAILKIPFEQSARWTKIRATLRGALDAFRRRSGKITEFDE